MSWSYDAAIQMLDRDGFDWRKFQEYFPFGELGLREGNYQRLVTKAVECLNTNEQRERLLDLLDAQACVFLEQVWVQNEELEKLDLPTIESGGHFPSAWLQINSNIRRENGLTDKNCRHLMLNLSEKHTLVDRLIGHEKN